MNYLKSKSGESLSYSFLQQNSDITVFFLGGYGSCMEGDKARALNQWAKRKKVNYLRFDYSGHGKSGGLFSKGTISKWLLESIMFFNHFKTGKNIIVGSSMGAWIGILLAEKNQKDLYGFMGIASAPDFTKKIWENINKEEQKKFAGRGFFLFPRDGEIKYKFYKDFMTDSFSNVVLGRKIAIYCPSVFVHGKCDDVASYSLSEKIISQCAGSQKKIVLIEDGGHTLSRKEDVKIILKNLEKLIT